MAQLSANQQRQLEAARKSENPVEAILGPPDDIARATERTRKTLGQLILGRAAEHAFETIYKREVAPGEFDLVDLREERNSTDYRLLNGSKRPVFRLNIKFFGSTFRRASELVGLEPSDCFPLATYKVHLALQKQVYEHLPYIFVVVGVEGLTGATVGSGLPSDIIDPLARVLASPRVTGKRALEDKVVDLVERGGNLAYEEALRRMLNAPWAVLSARRAEKLLKEKLFERAFALRVRGFAQQFRNAELDMHYSIQADMTPLLRFLQIIKEGGVQRATSMLERGDV